MKRLVVFVLCLLLVFGMSVGVSAFDGETRATSVQTIATVSSSGSAQVSSTIALHVETPLEELAYPVPANATSITLNGSRVLTGKTNQARLVNLTKLLGGMAGDFTFTVGYSVSNTVHPISQTEAGTADTGTGRRLQLDLPLLAGFAYPIDQFQFSINLPGNIDNQPGFISGYHQANIEKDLTYSVSGGNIAGRSWTALKDHETLNLRLVATDEMFPQTRAELPSLGTITTIIYICIGLALVYWVFFLRNFLPIREYPAVAPEGFGAGQLGSVLTMAGADLGLMVFSWAQLGYVVLQMDRRGRVLIHKRMEMGNERGSFEQKCFRNLFVRRDVVDTAGMAFARLHQTVSAQKAIPSLLRKKGGSVQIFRILTATAGFLCGTCFGILLGNRLDFGWLFMSVLSFVGLLCSWQIQHWTHGVFLHHRIRLWAALGIGALWLALGFAIGQFSLALLAVSIQFIAGFLAAFGGRRNEDGKLAMGQALSLRNHLSHLSTRKIQQYCQENPNYFFDMLPDAMALGCDIAFARRFGKSRMPACPYVIASDTHGLTATQWCQLTRQILDGMTARQRQMPAQTLRAVMRNHMK